MTTAQSPTNGATLGAAEFASAIKREGVTVLDVRTPEEFNEGHLEGAVNLDIYTPTFAADIAKLAKDGEYAVYCRSGNRSGQALRLMAQQGFTLTYHLDGGVGTWSQAGGTFIKG